MLTVAVVLRSGQMHEYTPERAAPMLDSLVQHWSSACGSLRLVILTDLDQRVYIPAGSQRRETDEGLYTLAPEAGHAGFCFPTSNVQTEQIRLRYGWAGWWSKLELFRPDLDHLGDLLYFDLDTRIVGDLAEIVYWCHRHRQLCFLQDFYRQWGLGSGMMFLPRESRPAVWQQFTANPVKTMTSYRGDQDFFEVVYGVGPTVKRWQDVVPGQVVSYKVHIKTGDYSVPDVRVVCFHGHPRPWQDGVEKKIAAVTKVQVQWRSNPSTAERPI